MAAPDVLTAIDPPHVHLAVVKPGEDAAAALLAAPRGLRRARDRRPPLPHEGRAARRARARVRAARRQWAATGTRSKKRSPISSGSPRGATSLIVTDADVLLEGAPEDYRIFVAMLEDVAREWGTPRTGEWPRAATPFHACLVVAEGRETARTDWGAPRLGR